MEVVWWVHIHAAFLGYPVCTIILWLINVSGRIGTVTSQLGVQLGLNAIRTWHKERNYQNRVRMMFRKCLERAQINSKEGAETDYE